MKVCKVFRILSPDKNRVVGNNIVVPYELFDGVFAVVARFIPLQRGEDNPDSLGQGISRDSHLDTKLAFKAGCAFNAAYDSLESTISSLSPKNEFHLFRKRHSIIRIRRKFMCSKSPGLVMLIFLFNVCCWGIVASATAQEIHFGSIHRTTFRRMYQPTRTRR